jgi:hypothetical protein
MGKFDTLKSLGATHCIVLCQIGRFGKKLTKNYQIVFFDKSRTTKTVKSERKLQSCLKLRKSQNPFCHINKNYENKNCNDMFIQFRLIVSQSL